MKVTFFLVFVLTLFASAGVYSQNTKLSLDYKDIQIGDLLQLIEQQSEFRFAYSKSRLNPDERITIEVKDKDIDEIMKAILDKTPLTYKIIDRYVVISDNAALDGNNSQQQKPVSGKITDSDGVPLPGVSVVVKGTVIGNITDSGGNYTISNVPVNATLLISFVGMKKQEIKVTGKSVVNVILVEEAVGIEEVVAVGYGVQKKRDIIGSISTIKSDAIKNSVVSTNFSSLLQGQAAGISVQSSSGRLGAGVDVKIRGLSSISAGTSPLWIIDGVPIITDINIDTNGSAAQSPMALINQSDIESIQVLKDAAATSIYGSRGSNGVIMVTTKSGITGKPSVNIDYSLGVSDLPFQQVHFINTKQWFQMKDESKQAYGLGNYQMSDFYSNKPYATEYLTRAQAESINTDWRKETMRKGSFQNINLSTVGGDNVVKYFISGNYRKDNSVMTNEYLERYGLRTNIDLKPTNSLELGTKINLSLSKGNRGKNVPFGFENGNKDGTSGGFSFVNAATVPWEPVYSLANPLLYYNPYAGNPVATSDPANMLENLDMYRVLANIYGEYHIPFIKGLSARTEVSMDFVQSNRNYWVSSVIRYNGSMAQDNASTNKTSNYNFFLKYNRTLGEHSLDLVAGTESQRTSSWYRSMQGEKLIGSYQELGTPSLLTSMSSRLTGENYLKSYFGRANYKFKGKYLAGISIRRDGASVFTPDYRWGNFLAFSAGWILSDETFMGNFGKNNSLKLRGSFGQTGNASIPGNLDVTNYSNGLAYGNGDIMGLNGTMVSSIGVSNLRWESTNNLDIGLDFGFFNNRINGSFAYYNKYVKGLLLASTLPPSSGISSIWGNIGNLVNSGIEFSVTSSNIETQNLKWSTTLNIAFNHNEVKKLTPVVDQAGTGMVGTPFITKVGYGIRDFYLADFAGIDPKTGLAQIYALDHANYDKTGETQRLKDDQGKDVLLLATSANSTTNIFHLKGKNTMPTYYGGISNKFVYKAFDLNILITFSGGNYIFDSFMRNIAVQNSDGEQIDDVYKNYWKKPGDIAKYQRLLWKGNVQLEDGTKVGMGDSRINTTQFLFKGDYIKLKSVSLGYTLPSSGNSKNIFKDFRVYGSVENLYTITKYPGWDPEGQQNVSTWDLPQLFSASIGITAKF